LTRMRRKSRPCLVSRDGDRMHRGELTRKDFRTARSEGGDNVYVSKSNRPRVLIVVSGARQERYRCCGYLRRSFLLLSWIISFPPTTHIDSLQDGRDSGAQ
jgi:hypothetical protein